MKNLFLILFGLTLVVSSCNTTQECRTVPMYNQKYCPQKYDTINDNNK